MNRFRIGHFFVLLVIISAGCSSAPIVEGTGGVSISRRGESLNTAESAPAAVSDPIVLPAAKLPEETEELNEVSSTEEIEGNQICQFLSNSKFEGEVASLINQARQDSLEKLDEHALLTQIARQHSQDMACLDFFSHNSPAFGSVESRFAGVGYEYIAVGEMIASGYKLPEEVVSAWLSSDVHRENLLSSNYVHIGVGYTKLAGDDAPSFWTVVLASPVNP